MSNLISSPETEARRAADYWRQTLTPDKVESIYLCRWAGYQAHLEMGREADLEDVAEHAESLFHVNDPTRDFTKICLAVLDARSPFGPVIVSESELRARRQVEISRLSSALHNLIELREGGT